MMFGMNLMILNLTSGLTMRSFHHFCVEVGWPWGFLWACLMIFHIWDPKYVNPNLIMEIIINANVYLCHIPLRNIIFVYIYAYIYIHTSWANTGLPHSLWILSRSFWNILALQSLWRTMVSYWHQVWELKPNICLLQDVLASFGRILHGKYGHVWL